MCDLLFSARYTTLSWLARSRYNTFKWSDLFQWDRTIKVQPSVLLYRIYPIELEMKDTTVRADSCTWTGPDLCVDQCVTWHRTAKSWDSMLMTPLAQSSLKLSIRNKKKGIFAAMLLKWILYLLVLDQTKFSCVAQHYSYESIMNYMPYCNLIVRYNYFGFGSHICI
jgi:hypothetical protein